MRSIGIPSTRDRHWNRLHAVAWPGASLPYSGKHTAAGAALRRAASGRSDAGIAQWRTRTEVGDNVPGPRSSAERHRDAGKKVHGRLRGCFTSAETRCAVQSAEHVEQLLPCIEGGEIDERRPREACGLPPWLI